MNNEYSNNRGEVAQSHEQSGSNPGGKNSLGQNNIHSENPYHQSDNLASMDSNQNGNFHVG